MWAIFQSAIWTLLSWIFRQIIVKFCLYVALYLFVTEAMEWLADKLSFDFNEINSGFSSLPSSIIWGLSLVRFDVGFPMVVSAYLLRFCVRRIPIIG